MTLPSSVKIFVDFATVLRGHGFAASPDQTMGFVEAISLLGPQSMDVIRSAAIAMFAIPNERTAEFDVLYQAHFYGQTLTPTVVGNDDEDLEVHEPSSETRDVEINDDEQEDPGEIASGAEVLSQRGFVDENNLVSLAEFERKAPRALPKRLSYRFAEAKRGRKLNMRQLLKSARQTEGDVVTLPWLNRKHRQRKILLLIDVSGSMQDLSDPYLRFAHALCQAAKSFECFTIGTRLTRITHSLKPKERADALTRVSQAVADFSGGTRIGDALGAFLSVPRYRGYGRGALILVLSDGLERGDATPMIEAVKNLKQIAWRLHWLSPLASEQDFAPSTEALAAILPMLDDLSGAADIESVCTHVLNVARAA